MKKELRKKFDVFKNSFRKLGRNYLKVIAADAVMIAFMVIITKLLEAFVQNKFSTMTPLAQVDLAQTGPALQAYVSQLQTFIITFVILFVIYILLLVFSWSTAQAYIWNIINSKKASFRHYRKSFLMNLLLIPVFIIVIILVGIILLGLRYGLYWLLSKAAGGLAIAYVIDMIATIVVFMPLVLYAINSLNLVYYFFSKTHLIGKSIAEMFEHIRIRYYLHYLFMTIIMTVASAVALICKFNDTLYLIINVILLILFLGWMRFYLKELVEKV